MAEDADGKTLLALREALCKPAPLSRKETVEFLATNFYMGPPKAKPYKGRGRRPKRTQYDDALGRRLDLWRLLVTLPGLRNGIGHAQVIRRYARNLEGSTPARKLAKRIQLQIELDGGPQIDISTIRRALKKMRRVPTNKDR